MGLFGRKQKVEQSTPNQGSSAGFTEPALNPELDREPTPSEQPLSLRLEAGADGEWLILECWVAGPIPSDPRTTLAALTVLGELNHGGTIGSYHLRDGRVFTRVRMPDRRVTFAHLHYAASFSLQMRDHAAPRLAGLVVAGAS